MRFGHLTYVVAVLCLMAGGATAQSSKQIEAVSKAAKALEQGRAAEALGAIEAAFKLGLDGDLASRALLIRAQANERSGKAAQAMADYNSAIWMQSLPNSERKKAVEGRERVMAALGLSSRTPSASTSGTATAPAATASTSAAQTSPAAPAGSSGGGVLGFFDDLFGGSSSPPPQQAAGNWSASVAPGSAAASDIPSRRDSRASSQRAARSSDNERRERAPAPAPKRERTAAVATEKQSGYDIDFGAAASQRAAQSQASQIKTELSDILVSRELTLLPSSGKVRIVAGPYQSEGSASALCRTIQARGVDCKVTER